MLNHLKSNYIKPLNTLESYLKTDVRYLAKGGFWLTLGSIASAFISFLSAVAFANLIPKETYGTYQYILSVSSILAIPTLAGINTAVTQSTARGYEKTIITGLKYRIKWGTFSLILASSLAVYYWLNSNHLLAAGFLIAGLFIPLSETLGIYVPYLQGKKKFKTLSLYELGAQSLSVGLLITSIWLSQNLLIILTTFFLSWLLARLFFLNLTLKKFPPNTEDDPNAITYGKHLTFMMILNTISSSVDKIILWKVLGPIQVAIYTFSLTIPLKAASFVKIINRLAFPKLATNDLKTIQKTLLPKILYLILPITLVTITYIIFTPLIFSSFFPKYLEAVFYAQVAGLLIIFQPFALISSALTAQAKKKELYIYNTASPIIKIVLFLLLIPPFQIIGAIIALVGSKIIDTIILIFLLKSPTWFSQSNREKISQ